MSQQISIPLMKSQGVWKSFITKEMGLVLLVTAITLIGLTVWHIKAIDRIEQNFIEEQKEVVLNAKVAQVETMFNTVYQNLRTISMLPSVRDIQGNNRLETDNEDVVASGRFSREGAHTVQSLYNNLVGLVSVSEIYAVIDGLNAQSGQIPFFMYDTVVFGEQAIAQEAEGTKPIDEPDEAEAAEYAYFPTQINAAKQKAPVFNFTKIDDIPAFLSPLMRTCDNTQYTSTQHGDEKDSHGVLYSVPFYEREGKLRGVISAIIRKNVLEAMLLGIPFVPITEKDKSSQNQQGWKMPEMGRFVLRNDQFGIHIADRRNTTIEQQIAQGKLGRNNFVVKLNVTSDAPWQLHYFIPESEFAEVTAAQKMLFAIVAVVVMGALVAALVAMGMLNRIRWRLGGDTQSVADVVHEVSNGNLNVVIPATVDADSVMGSMRKMLSNLRSLLEDIKHASDAIQVASHEIVQSNQDLSIRTDQQSDNLSKTAASMEQLQGAVRKNASSAIQANALILNASEVATQGGAVVRKVVDNMDTIHSSSKRIADITSVIDSIAFQTNILALNAAVEAARAGEQGRGFAVVASEVRSLAQRSANAAKEIKQLISESVGKVEDGSAFVKEAGDTMNQILNSVERVTTIMGEIVDASTEQSSGIDEVNDAVRSMVKATEQNVVRVQQAAGVAKTLGKQATHLVSAVGVFRQGDD